MKIESTDIRAKIDLRQNAFYLSVLFILFVKVPRNSDYVWSSA